MSYATLTLEEIRQEGYARGFNIASWQNLPEIGDTLPKHIDWEGIGTVEDSNDAASAFMMLCSDAEENDRCYSPFEFTAHEINEREDSDEAWEAFNEGIQAGFRANWESRKDYYEE